MADTSNDSHEKPVSAGDHPPKPVLTLRVGISGHRPKPEKFPEKWKDRVPQQLGEIFTAIEAVLAALKSENADFYAPVPYKVRLVSGLAEGADQMAVGAMPKGWALDAVLPFEKEYYLADFEHSAADRSRVVAAFETALAKATTVVVLPHDARMARSEPVDETEKKEYWRLRNQGYARLGAFLLGQIDVLVAVWDGERAEGPGGTADVVRGALNAGIPVIWISTLERIAPRMVLDVEDDGRALALEADALQGPLKSVLSTIIAVPAATAEPGHGQHEPGPHERLKNFFQETWPKPTRWVAYDCFKRRMEGKPLRRAIKPASREEAMDRLKPFIDDAPVENGALRERVRGILSTRFVWADALAVERSNWFRSAYIVCFLLAALLVAIALLGVFVHDWFHDNDAAMLGFKAVLALVELLLICYIASVVIIGRKSRWQQRWVEYRALAELLRSTPFLAYLGEHGFVHRTHDLEPASSTWFLWYLRATIREVGLPHAVLNGTYQNQLLRAVETHVIDGQLGYNKDAAATLAAMHHRLHVIGDLCFLATGAIVGLFFLSYLVYFIGGLGAGRPVAELVGWEHHAALALSGIDLTGPSAWFDKLGHLLFGLKSYVTFLAALLPALGAAVFGIRETGDFEGFAKRAQRTAEKLEQVKHDVAKAKRKLALESTTAALLASAQILSEDVGAWQSIYGRKQLGLPA